MLIGFVGYNDLPPGSASLPDDPGEPGDDDTRKRQEESLRKSKSRFRPGASRAGKYAWLISVGIHAAVILGAVLAARYFFHRSAPRPAPIESAGKPFDGFVVGPDSSDAVHFLPFGPVLATGADFNHHDLPDDFRDMPDVWLEPQTLASLQAEQIFEKQVVPSGAPGKAWDQPIFRSAHSGASTATQPGTSSPETPSPGVSGEGKASPMP